MNTITRERALDLYNAIAVDNNTGKIGYIEGLKKEEYTCDQMEYTFYFKDGEIVRTEAFNTRDVVLFVNIVDTAIPEVEETLEEFVADPIAAMDADLEKEIYNMAWMHQVGKWNRERELAEASPYKEGLAAQRAAIAWDKLKQIENLMDQKGYRA